SVWRANIATGQTTESIHIPGRVITHLMEPGNNVGRVFVADGHVAYVTTRDNLTKQNGVYRVDLTSSATERIVESDQFFSPSLWTSDVSDDGRTIVYVSQDAQHGEDVWVA